MLLCQFFVDQGENTSTVYHQICIGQRKQSLDEGVWVGVGVRVGIVQTRDLIGLAGIGIILRGMTELIVRMSQVGRIQIKGTITLHRMHARLLHRTQHFLPILVTGTLVSPAALFPKRIVVGIAFFGECGSIRLPLIGVQLLRRHRLVEEIAHMGKISQRYRRLHHKIAQGLAHSGFH